MKAGSRKNALLGEKIDLSVRIGITEDKLPTQKPVLLHTHVAIALYRTCYSVPGSYMCKLKINGETCLVEIDTGCSLSL